jgi:hypothetical protein
MVETENLRPSIFPEFMGQNFFLTGYRIFVRYHNRAGKNLRGLYILKSQTNQPRMKQIGNLFTHYNYETIDIEMEGTKDGMEISSAKEGLKVNFSAKNIDDIPLPSESIFADWKDARRFAGPLPFTFTYNEQKKQVLIVEGRRSNWKPRPIQINHACVPFLDSLKLKNYSLANGFIVENIPYEWKAGVIEKWQG